MPFLLLLVLTLTCLQSKWAPSPLGLDAGTGALLTWVGVAGFSIWAGVGSGRLRRRLHARPDKRKSVMRRYFAFRRYHLFGLLSFYLAAVYVLGWGWTAKSLLASTYGVDFQELLRVDRVNLPALELLILTPFVAGLVVAWSRFYDVDRAAHDLASGADEGPAPSRWAHVGLQARNNMLLVIPPLVLLLVEQTALQVFPELGKNQTIMAVFAFSLLVAAFITVPWLLRLVLGLRPLPEGPLRTRLLATARRLNFRCNDILVWNTRNNVANAMVTGPCPYLRYVVLTDKLINELSPDEIEAVFGHEMGHVKHHHMLFYIGFLLMSLVMLTTLCAGFRRDFFQSFLEVNLPDLRDWLNANEALSAVLFVTLVATYIVVVFGFISRRCERQADIYGCRTVSVPVFIDALEKVARLNGINRERPGWLSSWQHSTIALRVEFLQRMNADPDVEPHFQRRVGLVKWGVVLGLLGLVALMFVLSPEQVVEAFSKL